MGEVVHVNFHPGAMKPSELAEHLSELRSCVIDDTLTWIDGEPSGKILGAITVFMGENGRAVVAANGTGKPDDWAELLGKISKAATTSVGGGTEFALALKEELHGTA